MTAIRCLAVLLFIALWGTSLPAGADIGAVEAAYESGDYAAVLELATQLAEQGDGVAHWYLGHLYLVGQGVTQDAARALAHFEQAEASGYATALNDIGIMYRNGWGVQQDYAKAIAAFSRGAELGDAGAQNNLAIMYNTGTGVARDDRKAVELYWQAAEQGYAPAQGNLGLSYLAGEGVGRDPARAFEWLSKAAEGGYVQAQFNLGALYLQGEGVEKNLELGLEWYRKAAQNGSVGAQKALAGFFYSGAEVARDPAQAFEWYLKAAEAGDPEAQTMAGLFYYEGIGTEKSVSLGIQWLNRPAQKGYAEAQYRLGVAYAQGTAVPQDVIHSYVWWELAARGGHELAARNRDSIVAVLTPEQISYANDMADSWAGLIQSLSQPGPDGEVAIFIAPLPGFGTLVLAHPFGWPYQAGGDAAAQLHRVLFTPGDGRDKALVRTFWNQENRTLADDLEAIRGRIEEASGGLEEIYDVQIEVREYASRRARGYYYSVYRPDQEHTLTHALLGLDAAVMEVHVLEAGESDTIGREFLTTLHPLHLYSGREPEPPPAVSGPTQCSGFLRDGIVTSTPVEAGFGFALGGALPDGVEVCGEGSTPARCVAGRAKPGFNSIRLPELPEPYDERAVVQLDRQGNLRSVSLTSYAADEEACVTALREVAGSVQRDYGELQACRQAHPVDSSASDLAWNWFDRDNRRMVGLWGCGLRGDDDRYSFVLLYSEK